MTLLLISFFFFSYKTGSKCQTYFDQHCFSLFCSSFSLPVLSPLRYKPLHLLALSKTLFRKMHLSPGLKAADYSKHLGQIREYPLPLSHWRCFQTKEGLAHNIKQSKGQLISSKQLWVGRGGTLEVILIKEQKSLLGSH